MEDHKDIPFDIEKAKKGPFGYYPFVPHPEYKISRGGMLGFPIKTENGDIYLYLSQAYSIRHTICFSNSSGRSTTITKMEDFSFPNTSVIASE